MNANEWVCVKEGRHYDLRGVKAGYLTLGERDKARPGFIHAVCICGKTISTRVSNLRLFATGGTKSCGCKFIQARVDAKNRHGEANAKKRSKEYRAWAHIQGRCHNKTDSGFQNYGGRGIYVCDAWRASFEQFLADMGRAPSKDHSIERIDNDGPYSPSNCKWASKSEQAKNTRRTVRVAGMCLADYCRQNGISYGAVYQRRKRGMTLEQALGMSS